jgi:hypothetical protein
MKVSPKFCEMHIVDDKRGLMKLLIENQPWLLTTSKTLISSCLDQGTRSCVLFIPRQRRVFCQTCHIKLKKNFTMSGALYGTASDQTCRGWSLVGTCSTTTWTKKKRPGFSWNGQARPARRPRGPSFFRPRSPRFSRSRACGGPNARSDNQGPPIEFTPVTHESLSPRIPVITNEGILEDPTEN